MSDPTIDQQATGLEAMAKAEEDAASAAGVSPPGEGRVIPGTDPSAMANPYAGSTATGTARESNEDLMARMIGGTPAPNVVPTAPEGQAASQAPNNAGQEGSTSQRDAQSTIDQLKAENTKLQEEALVGRYVLADDRLAQIASDSMRGVTSQPGMGGMGYDENLREGLGLPDDFIFNPDEMYIQGTASNRLYQADIKRNVDTEINSAVGQMRQEEQLRQEGAIVRERFLSADHTEEEFNELMKWVQDGGNFTLEKLWAYKMGGVAPVSGADLSRPSIKQHTPSIGGMAGAGAVPVVPPEVQIAADLLKESDLRKNPFSR